MRLLLVEDYAPLRTSLRDGLCREGYAVDASGDGEEGWWYAQSNRYDGMILDRMLPGLDGIEILQRLRAADDHTPVLLLTAMDSIEDRVDGLDAGADDYLTKPFAVPELLARLRRLLRRQHGRASRVLSCGPLRYDDSSRQAMVGDQVVALTAREVQLLAVFLNHQGEVISRDELWEHCYDFAQDPNSNVLEVLIGRLRRKLKQAGAPEIIHTRRGLGYVMQLP